MALSTYCTGCLLRKQLDSLDKNSAPEALKQKFLHRMLQLFADASPSDNAPALLYRVEALHRELLGPLPGFEAQKKLYNDVMLQQVPHMQSRIDSAADPVKAALQLALVGNYIDFGAAGNVEKETLQHLLDDAFAQMISDEEYAAFCEDADKANTLIYLTDNCGEIVADKLLIRQLRKRWPQLSITVIVRGGAAVNDATTEDARAVGMEEIAPVVSSGVAMAGTDIRLVGEEARTLLQSADLVLAKGQGNFETMNEGELPVYFAFLCKCPWFTRRFGLELYKPVFIRRERLHLRTI